jgi:hypothetical protein
MMIYHDSSRAWEENLSDDNSPNRFWAQAQGFQIPPNHHESLRSNDPAQHMLLPAKLPKDHQKTAGITLPGPVDGGPNLTTQIF